MAKFASLCVLWNLSGHFFLKKIAAMICTSPFQKTGLLLTLPSEHGDYSFLLMDQPTSICLKLLNFIYM